MPFNWGDVGSGAAAGAAGGAMIGGPWGALGGAGIGALGGAASSFFSGDDEDEEDEFVPEFLRSPEYAEATEARGTWWDKLQEWGGQEGYGAIAPNWDEIWGLTQDKIRQYYWGGPEGGYGLSGKVKSSAAERGVSDSPALQTELTRMGMGEAGDIRKAGVAQSTARAEFGERGRQNWMDQLMGLSKMKVPGVWRTSEGYQPEEEEGIDWGSLFGQLGSAGIKYASTKKLGAATVPVG